MSDSNSDTIVNQEAVDAANSQLERERLQAEADANGATDIVELDQVDLEITRDNTKTTTTVFAHEQAIFELIHGEENVEEKGRRTVKAADFYPDSEMDRLLRKFGKNGEKAVLQIYGGNPRAIAEAAGVRYETQGKKRNKSGEQAMIVDHDNPEATQSGAAKVVRVIKEPKAAAKTTQRSTAPVVTKAAAKKTTAGKARK